MEKTLALPALSCHMMKSSTSLSRNNSIDSYLTKLILSKSISSRNANSTIVVWFWNYFQDQSLFILHVVLCGLFYHTVTTNKQPIQVTFHMQHIFGTTCAELSHTSNFILYFALLLCYVLSFMFVWIMPNSLVITNWALWYDIVPKNTNIDH